MIKINQTIRVRAFYATQQLLICPTRGSTRAGFISTAIMANSQASGGHYPAGNSSAPAPYNSSVSQGQTGSVGSAREVHSSTVDRSKAATGNQGSTWKIDSEDMLRARKSAQRVILSKFKNFWPSDDDAKLAARAFDFERGEYEVVIRQKLLH